MKKKVIEEAVKAEPLKQARFYGRPGLEPVGYRCGDIEVMRKRGESVEELRTRSRNSVAWLNDGTVHIFTPLREQ